MKNSGDSFVSNQLKVGENYDSKDCCDHWNDRKTIWEYWL